MRLDKPYLYLLAAVGVALLVVAMLAPNGYINIVEILLSVSFVGIAVWYLRRPRSSEKDSLASLPWIAAVSAPKTAERNDKDKGQEIKG